LTEVTLEIAALFLLVGLWAAILPRWRLGLELYILFIPFAGAVELWLYPAPWAVLIKDVLFVMPTYIGFAMSSELRFTLGSLPKSFASIVLLFAGLVLVQALNPAGPGLLATVIGLKVWLFYVPMLLLGRAYVRDRASLLRLSHLMICLVWLPCLVGVVQWLLALAFGYQYAISLFYGAAARAATQNFSSFNNGLIRIPSTFSFPAQYLNYILCMLVPVLGCASIETEHVWQTLRAISLPLLCVAGFMSGTRAAFVMIPLMLLAFYMLRRGAFGVLWAGLLMAGFLAVALSVSGIDSTGLLQMETDLTQSYTTGQAGMIEDALQLTWIGQGVGSNTGASRFTNKDVDGLTIFENYYAKAIVELGLAGLAVVVLFQVFPLMWAVRFLGHIGKSSTATYASAMAACFLIFLIYNYKGFIIDLDPANMLYWLFAGILFSLPTVDAAEARHAEPTGGSEVFALS
jgi:hypothetical protein